MEAMTVQAEEGKGFEGLTLMEALTEVGVIGGTLETYAPDGSRYRGTIALVETLGDETQITIGARQRLDPFEYQWLVSCTPQVKLTVTPTTPWQCTGASGVDGFWSGPEGTNWNVVIPKGHKSLEPRRLPPFRRLVH